MEKVYTLIPPGILLLLAIFTFPLEQTAELLWLHLPDSMPQFPPLDTQNPVDFFSIVRDSTQTTNSN